jgi:hypothetical protein
VIPSSSATACSQPSGFVTDDTDCDDTSRYVQPGGIEVCDLLGVDEDCSGLANDADPNAEGKRTWYVDSDEDGYGSKATVQSCFEAPGLATVGNDCNDKDYDINPGTPEVCDPLDKDEDCDGYSDVNDPEGPLNQPLYYIDVDGRRRRRHERPGSVFLRRRSGRVHHVRRRLRRCGRGDQSARPGELPGPHRQRLQRRRRRLRSHPGHRARHVGHHPCSDGLVRVPRLAVAVWAT